MKLDLTVIIPCYERADLTRALLRSLAASSDEFKTILVDDGSPEALKPVADEFQDQLELAYIRQPVSRGPAAARNAGVRAAATSFVAFTDNDCTVDPLWVRSLTISITKASPLVVGVGGRVLAAGDDIFSRYYTYHRILDPFLLDGRYLYLVTANCAFRRFALEAVGGFDESVRQAGGEDPGLCFKLLERGLRLDHCSQAVVWHRYRSSFADFARTFFRYGKGCRMQYENYGKNVSSSNEAIPAEVTFGCV